MTDDRHESPSLVTAEGDLDASDGAPVDRLDPRVKAALDRIADSAGIDVNAVPEVLSDVYRRLNAAMTDPEGD